jgi:hypothetical protein
MHDYTEVLSARDVVDALAAKADEVGQNMGDYAAGQQIAYEDAADIAHQAIANEDELTEQRDKALADVVRLTERVAQLEKLISEVKF